MDSVRRRGDEGEAPCPELLPLWLLLLLLLLMVRSGRGVSE